VGNVPTEAVDFPTLLRHKDLFPFAVFAFNVVYKE
jgi:hypothetical protein